MSEWDKEIPKLGSHEMLRKEAEYLHFSMFRRCSTDNILNAYVRAHAEIPNLGTASEQQIRTVRVIVSRRLDALGIEPWLRDKKVRHLLGAKILLVAYLAECDACHTEFSRRNSGGRMALAKIVHATLMAVLRLLRGRIQKALYGLI